MSEPQVKKSKIVSTLDQLKTMTTIVADTGDFEGMWTKCCQFQMVSLILSVYINIYIYSMWLSVLLVSYFLLVNPLAFFDSAKCKWIFVLVHISFHSIPFEYTTLFPLTMLWSFCRSVVWSYVVYFYMRILSHARIGVNT